MNRFRAALNVSLFVIVSLGFVLIAQAQATRTWVSGVGDDVNPCSRTAPCKTFAGAIAKTATGGEINAIDPGGFGSVTISKSISIDGTGTQSSILAAFATGVNINIVDPKDTAKTVRIRGLSINGASTGKDGIVVTAASKVFIEDTVIDGFTGNGINAKAGQVFITNTSISNNAGSGINVAAGIQVAVSETRIVFNNIGVAGDIRSLNGVVLYGNKNDSGPPR